MARENQSGLLEAAERTVGSANPVATPVLDCTALNFQVRQFLRGEISSFELRLSYRSVVQVVNPAANFRSGGGIRRIAGWIRNQLDHPSGGEFPGERVV